MAIYRLLKNLAFKSPEAAATAEAYEGGLIALGITDRADPRTENLAIAILALFCAGETDPKELILLACRIVRRET
jgi:hypothetical protein